MAGSDQNWHESFPVKWTPTGSLLYARERPLPAQRDQAWKWRDARLTVSGKREIIQRFLIGDGRSVRGHFEMRVDMLTLLSLTATQSGDGTTQRSQLLMVFLLQSKNL